MAYDTFDFADNTAHVTVHSFKLGSETLITLWIGNENEGSSSEVMLTPTEAADIGHALLRVSGV